MLPLNEIGNAGGEISLADNIINLVLDVLSFLM